MKRYTKNKHPIVSIQAKLLSKRQSDYYAIPDKIPFSSKMYELEFETTNGNIVLEVSSFEYNVVEQNMTGLLVYQGYKLLSFGEWIKDINSN